MTRKQSLTPRVLLVLTVAVVVPAAAVGVLAVRHAVRVEPLVGHALAPTLLREILIAIVAALALSLVIGLLLAARLTRPLRQLAARADAIAGSTGDTTPLRAPGELGELAARLERLARRLSRREALRAALARGDRQASLATLATSVTHELSGPVTAVLGHARLLAEGKASDHPDRPGLELIAGQAAHMKQVLDGLLDHARSDRVCAGQGAGEPADLHAVLRHTADLLAPPLRRGGVRLDMDLDATLPPVAAEAHALQLALSILVRHAARAMPGAVMIESGRAPGGVAACVCVTDQGPGVPGDERARTVAPWIATTDADLAVCKHLIARAGGSVDVTAGPGGTGTRARVMIPMVQPSPASPPGDPL